MTRSVRVIIEKKLGKYTSDPSNTAVTRLEFIYSKNEPLSDELLKKYLDTCNINSETAGDALVNHAINNIIRVCDVSNSISFVLEKYTISIRLEKIEEDEDEE